MKKGGHSAVTTIANRVLCITLPVVVAWKISNQAALVVLLAVSFGSSLIIWVAFHKRTSEPLIRSGDGLWLTVFALVGLGVGAICIALSAKRTELSLANRFGLLLALWSCGLISHTTISLKGLWTDGVQVVKGHPIVTTGPFSLVRHPMYLGYMLLLPGAALSSGSNFGALVWAATAFFTLKLRVTHEERTLVAQATTGTAYRLYQTSTPQLCPTPESIWRYICGA